MAVERAARVTSPVEHGSIVNQQIYTVGGVVVGALIIFTGGASLAVFALAAAAAGTTKSVGTLLDHYVAPTTASEKIAKGVPNVIYEEEKREAANVSPKTRTDEHNEQPLIGSDSVFIENMPACRRFDTTKCNGIILDGAPHIFIGGNPGVAGKKPGEVLPTWTKVLGKTIDAAGLVSLPKTWLEGASYAVDVVDYFNGLPEGEYKDFLFLKGLGGLSPP